MLSVAFALNCGLFRTFMDAGKEGVYAEEGYQPMLQAFLDNPEIKFTLFFGGVTTKALFAARLGESIPDLVARGKSELSQALAGYAQTPGVQFRTVGEIVRDNPPGEEPIVLRTSARGYREWFEGSEKVAVVWQEARSETKAARYAILVASKAGLAVEKARELLEGAWLKLLEAEISTGRRACAHPAGKATRIIHSLDLALEARQLAQQAADAIGT